MKTVQQTTASKVPEKGSIFTRLPQDWFELSAQVAVFVLFGVFVYLKYRHFQLSESHVTWAGGFCVLFLLNFLVIREVTSRFVRTIWWCVLGIVGLAVLFLGLGKVVQLF